MPVVDETKKIKYDSQDEKAVKPNSDRNIVYLSDDAPSGVCMCRIECPGFCACASK